jgi:hypothetical protein
MMRWVLQVTTPHNARPIDVTSGRPVVLGHGRNGALQTDEASSVARHVALVARDDGLVVEVLRGEGVVTLNDIPVAAHAMLRVGDELRVGASRLVLLPSAARATVRPRIAEHDELMYRLEDELRRAALRRPIAVIGVYAPRVNIAARQAIVRRVMEKVAELSINASWGELAPDILCGVLPECSEAILDAVAKQLPETAGARAKVAAVRAPRDGLTADALVARVWRMLLRTRPEARELVVADPVMVRLAVFMEDLANSPGSVCLVGPTGSGRHALLHHMLAVTQTDDLSVSAVDVLHTDRTSGRAIDDPWPDAEEARADGAGAPQRILRDLEVVPPAAIPGLIRRWPSRLLAVSKVRPASEIFDFVIEVPALASRAEDIAVLAEHFLSKARVRMSRPRLTLGREAASTLASWPWPGNVQELENVLIRAARTSVRDEIGRDALPARMLERVPAGDFRGAMQSAEREYLLEVLSRTRWNVSATATRLGVPRRTIVYRMARLGLKRPAR